MTPKERAGIIFQNLILSEILALILVTIYKKEQAEVTLSPTSKDKATRDDRVITLLNKLGGTLLRSEQERLEHKEQLEDLENRSDQSEKIFLTLQDKLNKNDSVEKALREKQENLEQEQQRQAEQLQKTADLHEKIEEALTQHSRLNRRLDKMVQDKTRMIRKLESIEETVIETQTALQSKALVLLTDQAAAAQGHMPQLSADPSQKTGASSYQTPSAWGRPFSLPALTGVAAMVVLSLIGGWSFSQLQQKSEQTLIQTVQATAVQATADNFELENTDVTVTESDAVEDSSVLARLNNDDLERMTTAIDADMPDLSRTNAFPENTIPDDETLLADLAADPDSLAASLNEISPVAGPVPDNIENEAIQPNENIQAAAFTPQDTKINESDIEDFVKQQREKRSLTERTSPDPDLPPVIQDVEKKALEGVAEAQHDLAAIYTAGHGGVKPDYSKAAFWFKEAAIQGVANARYNLGVLYHQGLGIDKNVDKALGWYRAAAQLGHREAQYNLGIAHIEGIGTEYNPRLAANFFEQAANGGILEAAYNLGLIHENGLLGEARPDEALYWYKKATDQGSPEAKAALDQLAGSMNLSPDEVKALYNNIQISNDTPYDLEPIKKATPAPVAEKHSALKKKAPRSRPSQSNPPRMMESRAEPSPVRNNQAVIAQIQEQLIRMGLYPGPADGAQGPLTEDAIRSYQAMYDLNSDGRTSEALLVHMLTSELNSTISPAAGNAVELLPPGDFGSRED